MRGRQQRQPQPGQSSAQRCAIAWPVMTLALALAAIVVPGCDFPGRPNPADRPRPQSHVLDFTFLYQHNCAGCHGRDGQFGPAPPLNDPIFLAIVPDDELMRVITEGRAETPMPPFARRHGGPLSEEQIHSLARGIKERWAPVEPKADLPPYLWSNGDDDAPVGATRLERGLAAYTRACAGCHGASGEGADGGGTPGRINDRAFLALVSDQALRRYVITGRPDLGMPTYAEDDGRSSGFQPLTSAEINDLVALLAAWRAGETEPEQIGKQAALRRGTN
jgi:mono/diheme cytochrome c family protein